MSYIIFVSQIGNKTGFESAHTPVDHMKWDIMSDRKATSGTFLLALSLFGSVCSAI